MIMEYAKFKDKIVLRADRGEEVVSLLAAVCEREKVSLAFVSGIGAAQYVKAGFYSVADKKYSVKEYRGELEILSLTGNITRKDGEVYTHFHICFATEDGVAHGGHLNECVIGGTGEIEIALIDGKVGRKFDREVGLNVFAIEKQGKF